MATWNLITRTFPLLVHRIKSGGVYPARIEGMSNVFVGDTDPGVAMDPDEDFWANPNFTTLDTVATSAATTGTALNLAVQDLVDGHSLWISASDMRYLDTSVTFDLISSSDTPAIMLPPSVGRAIRLVVNLPAGWSRVWFDIYWTHEAESHAADIRWITAVRDIEIGEEIPETATDSFSYTDAVNDIEPNQFTVTTPTTPVDVNGAGGPTVVQLTRLGSSGADTFASDIAVIGLRLRKAD